MEFLMENTSRILSTLYLSLPNFLYRDSLSASFVYEFMNLRFHSYSFIRHESNHDIKSGLTLVNQH